MPLITRRFIFLHLHAQILENSTGELDRLGERAVADGPSLADDDIFGDVSAMDSDAFAQLAAEFDAKLASGGVDDSEMGTLQFEDVFEEVEEGAEDVGGTDDLEYVQASA